MVMLKKMDRGLAAVLGGFVADAASMPVHWIYDVEKLKTTLGQEGWKQPEFFDTLSCPFYSAKEFPNHYEKPGDSSPYAEESLALLEYLASKKGKFESGQDWTDFLISWAKEYGGRKNHCTKLLEENVEKGLKYPESGADDAQANAFWKVPLITLLYAGTEDYYAKVEQAIRAHQNHEKSVSLGLSFARMLEKGVQGGSLEECIEAGKTDAPVEVVEAITFAQKSAIKSAEEDTQENLEAFLSDYANTLFQPGMNEMYKPILSRTCGLPQSFVVSIKLLLDSQKVMGDDKTDAFFTNVIRRNIHAGGDNCGRIGLIGPLLGASGVQIPQSWIDSTTQYDHIETTCNSFTK